MCHCIFFIYQLTSWYTQRCWVNKVKKMYVVGVPRRHPLLSVTVRCHLLSPVVTRCHPSSPVTTHCHPFSPVVTCRHPLSPVVTRCHPTSSVVTRPSLLPPRCAARWTRAKMILFWGVNFWVGVAGATVYRVGSWAMQILRRRSLWVGNFRQLTTSAPCSQVQRD